MFDRVEIAEGSEVMFGRERCQVLGAVDTHHVRVKRLSDGVELTVHVFKLQPTEEPLQPILDVIETTPLADWKYDHIREIIGLEGRTREDVKRVARAADADPATIYRWMAKFKKGGKAGLNRKPYVTSRPDPDPSTPEGLRELLLKRGVDAYFDTSSGSKSVKAVYTDLKAEFRKHDLKPPHQNTLRNRILERDPRALARKKRGRAGVRRLDAGIPGFTKDLQFPLQYLQIDHTKLNLFIVDEETRESIGRLWLTVAICVWSRVIAGYYLSFDAPSQYSVAMCLYQAIMPKGELLTQYELPPEEVAWPNYGFPDALGMDGGKEFHTDVIKEFCEQHNIGFDPRRKGRVNDGAHIENLIGGFKKAIDSLPGASKRPKNKHEGVDPEAEATFTKAEAEEWLVKKIVLYHMETHSELGMSPTEKFRIGLIGMPGYPPRGLLPPPRDPRRLWLELLYKEERTVQPYGLQLFSIRYWDDVLRPWVGERVGRRLRQEGVPKKFTVRFDPRDMDVIYFYDPVEKDYFDLHKSARTRPNISLKELKAAKRRLKDEGFPSPTEDQIFDCIEEMRELVEKARAATKAARREAARKAQYAEDAGKLPTGKAPEPDRGPEQASAEGEEQELQAEDDEFPGLYDVIEVPDV